MKRVWMVVLAIGFGAIGCDGERAEDPPAPVSEGDRWVDLSIEPGSTGEDGREIRSIRVELAVTAQESFTGLLYRNSIPWTEGMLFLYRGLRDRRGLTMWRSEAESVRFPLTAAFLDEDGRIVHLVDMDVGPDPVEGYVCPVPSRFVLEMNLGYFEKEGIVPGDRVVIPEAVREISDRWGRP